MASSAVTRWWLSLISWVVVVLSISKQATAQPQINLLNRGCSQYNATNIRNFFDNLNATFSDLRNQLSNESKLFATAQQSRSSDPVYAMVQCRNYLSNSDCLTCYDAAVAQIRNCSASNGARVIYDGCFLRYESNSFYDQTTLPGNVQICSNRTASPAVAFNAAAETLLQNLELATPRISGYFAATNTEVGNGGPTIYGVAQCAETISQSGCQDCLTVAYRNIIGCLPNADGRAIDAACFIRYSNTAFFAENQTINITPFLGGGGGSSKKNAIIGGVVGGAGLVLIIAALFLWYHLSRKQKVAARGNILGATELQGPNTYNYKDLKSATNNFSEKNKIGEGGFGDVYKATLQNGNIIAVKKLDLSISRAKADFETEVRLISNVHHRNLVRLLGCCTKGGQLLLIYEFMPNGSLDRYLYGDKRGTLNWKQRFNIIFGTARGLAYLHDQYHVCIIHRDIKPSNILLDNDFIPKIADFGLARLLPENQSHVSTKFAGTLGYTAPEYAIHGHLSEKVDTYSFGVVILEVISGRRCTQMNDESDTEYLLEEAWKLHEAGMEEKLVDETLDENDFKAKDVKKLIDIALACTQSPASSRPTMSEVLVMLLTDNSVEQKAPSRPSFFDSGKSLPVDSSVSTGSTQSNATASVSRFTGR
ncbi:cysteine-rich receptor kinase 2 [Olea europaea subsp. europaea]|uniref:Cysteine-rich receptor kinase 2 n=1 Tax=Olea europaea subsp. europaea TaxID=158383 RepID=A0A8S0R9Y7_OLEEU|nr:cysteine-rich receptor kinase 2 [Olea europaea subsp. europaea]